MVAAMNTLSGTREECAQLRADETVEHREHTAVPERACSEQQVLTRGIDGCTFRRRGFAVPDEARQHEHRRALEVVDVALHHSGHARLGRIVDLTGTAVVAVGGTLARPGATRTRSDQCLRFTRDIAVGEHEETERLTVRSARRATRGEEHRPQRVHRNRLVEVAADRSGGDHPLEQSERVGRQRFEREIVGSHAEMIARTPTARDRSIR